MQKLLIAAACSLLLASCALPPLIALDAVIGAALEQQSYTGQGWQMACAAVDGQYDAATGDCENSFFQ